MDSQSEDEWKQTQSFGRDDLLVLAKVADQAHTWTVENTVRKTDEIVA